ncbi:hypothetical protein LA080_005739 [Diaporthe eres]|nr:hypothetical protein LA080_005739 [Diaporthe eres]
MDDYTPSSNQHDFRSTSVSSTQAPTTSTAPAWNLSTGTSTTPSATPIPEATASKKRQRSRGVVTLHACTECRIKRAKSKESLRNTIEQLRRQQASNELVINALSHSSKWREVLCHLRRGRSVEAIANWLVNQPGPSLGAGTIPSSRLSSADTDLTNLATYTGVDDPLYASEMSDGSVSASTGSSMSSDCLLDPRYNTDTNGQWSQLLDAGQAQPNRRNSQPAAGSSQPFHPNVNTNVPFWANLASFPATPSPGSSIVAGSGDWMDNSLLWPFPMQEQPVMPTGNAFAGAGFGMI